MNLREPKKKRRSKLKEQLPFPIVLGNKNEWTNYTAHLTDIGSSISDPNEIIAVHSMGFFGKGSLSRGFPSFGKARYGAPPIIRNRQWIRRQAWLTEFNKLNVENDNKYTNLDESKCNDSQSEDPDKDDIKCLNYPRNESTMTSTHTMHIIDKQIEDTDNNQEEYINDSQKKPRCPTDFNCKEDNIYFTNSNTHLENKLLVLPDSDSETDNYLKEVKPKIECESFPVQEALHLTFEETFFLLYGLGCLNLIDFDGNLLDIDNAWHIFCKNDTNFIQKYVVYHYFRSKGWVVKPGLKYGGDFLLYKHGPPFYHASYIVIIDILDGDSLVRDQSKSMHKFTWNHLFGLERLSETAAKEILFAQVLWASSVPKTSDSFNLEMLPEFSVRELLWRRWNFKSTKDIEEEDDDSC